MKRAEFAEGVAGKEPAELGQEGVEPAVPWEEIASGRFQPKRIRGSCRGRALG